MPKSTDEEPIETLPHVSDPNPPPYYVQTSYRRELRATIVKAADQIGLHLLCPRAGCRRGRRCADGDHRDLPFCFYHYRGLFRYLVMLKCDAIKHGLRPAAEEGGAGPDPDSSVLGRLRQGGWEIERLRRPASAGRCGWYWEKDPDASAAYYEMLGRPSPWDLAFPGGPGREEPADEASRES